VRDCDSRVGGTAAAWRRETVPSCTTSVCPTACFRPRTGPRRRDLCGCTSRWRPPEVRCCAAAAAGARSTGGLSETAICAGSVALLRPTLVLPSMTLAQALSKFGAKVAAHAAHAAVHAAEPLAADMAAGELGAIVCLHALRRSAGPGSIAAALASVGARPGDYRLEHVDDTTCVVVFSAPALARRVHDALCAMGLRGEDLPFKVHERARTPHLACCHVGVAIALLTDAVGTRLAGGVSGRARHCRERAPRPRVREPAAVLLLARKSARE
jgi:hypothetical protein